MTILEIKDYVEIQKYISSIPDLSAYDDVFEKELNQKWVSVKSLKPRLSTIMNTRNNEKSMRLLIIELQKELGE